MQSLHTLVGFGFGPIQAGLFAKEACESGRFSRLVVAEIDAPVVHAVREDGNRYAVNVAHDDHIEKLSVDGVELLNPRDAGDRERLLEALAQATEIATCLPSVDAYGAGGANSVASLLGEGLCRDGAAATIVYTAENNNQAAELLEVAVAGTGVTSQSRPVAFLNTVVGKMSRVVDDTKEIAGAGLTPIAPGVDRAYLVEAFNHILVSTHTIPGFEPGIAVFEEKDDLLPFEEAKLYGHNAIHALLGFVGQCCGVGPMADLRDCPEIIGIAREAFVSESGAALVAKHGSLDDSLFTSGGFLDYAEDLLDRMMNPFLADATSRAARDPVRKLGYDDRIFGTMRLALDQGITPRNMAIGAAAGLRLLLRDMEQYRIPGSVRMAPDEAMEKSRLRSLLEWLWGGASCPALEPLSDLVLQADPVLTSWVRER